MAHLPLKDPPEPQAWASDRAPGFVLPAGAAPQSSQGTGHGSHGSWPRPHKHRGLPGPGQPGANPGVFTKDGDPSWNLRSPLSVTLSCVFYKLPSPACLWIGEGPQSALCQPRAWQTLPVQPAVRTSVELMPPPRPTSETRMQSKPTSAALFLSALRVASLTPPPQPGAGTTVTRDLVMPPPRGLRAPLMVRP